MNDSDSPAAQVLTRADGARIAYHRTPGASPGLMFLGGFASDMDGTKALALEAYARQHGRAFLRFDYQGHGQSSGRFADGTIGQWRDDALSVLDQLTEGPQVLVGSSMGGWIMLLAALARPERVAGLVGIAAAPDFTDALLWQRLTAQQQREVEDNGVWQMPSDYGDPVPLSHQLFQEGRKHKLLGRPIQIACPVRLLQGTADAEVPADWAVKLQHALASDDVEATLVKDADHRLSTERDLQRLYDTLDRLFRDLEQDAER
ncbi:alpha/beta hydrolase [Rhodovibrio sodomensis]|uniref:Alpha/beta hydrolase n=1 Tax=Rhodovibrio sodomensis TaxID=1088 RepID=A0ABS1DCK3_9PROT|nr:alpha/beta hydrolase [Rhodovibrio sodomensis]MBK1667949.1 alpha/beta hydrolase [Rhodovibrio sodomensis]